MSVEFNLGHQDHAKVEDFLAGGVSGIGAITLHATFAKYQSAAAEAARESGVDVLYDPRTERLAYPDPADRTSHLPGYTGAPYDLAVLAARPDLRERLAHQVLDAHPDEVTITTPPSFYIVDQHSASLNLALAEEFALASQKPTRPRVLISSRLPLFVASELAAEYVRVGITEIDLRMSPMSGESEGIRKIRHVFKVADIFRNAGLRVVLGNSGNLGQVAFALGHVDAYSVGIGENEHVNHATKLGTQVKPQKVKLDGEGKKKGGVWEGIYLPGLAYTVSRKVGVALLGHSDIRTRIGCRIDACATSISGPLRDYKTHYLHSRSVEMSNLLGKPAAWRATAEIDRLQRALELRQLVNDNYRPASQPVLKTRTLSSLLEDLHEERRTAVA